MSNNHDDVRVARRARHAAIRAEVAQEEAEVEEIARRVAREEIHQA